MKSLEAISKKSGRSQAGVGRSIKNKKMALMDLNGDSDDDNHDDGTMEREKQALELLERALT
jgi:DNA-binding transcriptional regulator GbsR (MarR family)